MKTMYKVVTIDELGLSESVVSDDKLMNLIPKMPKGYVGKNTGTGEYTISTPNGEDIVLTQSRDKKKWSYEPSNIALKVLEESQVTEKREDVGKYNTVDGWEDLYPLDED